MGGQGEWDGASWRKSRRSGGSDQCVCVAVSLRRSAIRDGKDADRTTIVLPRAALLGLLNDIKRGVYDLR